MAKKEEKLLKLSAIDPYIEDNIVKPTEKEIRGFDWISFGEKNDYPAYLLGLYKNVPTLQSIINGCKDYTVGDDVVCSIASLNPSEETISTMLEKIALDYWIHGAFAINVIRNRAGNVAAIYYLNVANVRSNKEGTMFYYSEEWDKSAGRVKFVSYPAFSKNSTETNSILYVKNAHNSIYGLPVYAAAVKGAEIMQSVDEYHLNAINNGFMASYIVSLNNGQPSQEIQQEIEDELNEKFSGYQNAGRIMVTFNKSKETETTVQKLESENVGEKYNTLVSWSERQLFTSFRANPNLFGIATEGTGFAGEEYENTFKLFNRTMIRPAQRLICDTFARIYGVDVLTIKPFSMEGDVEKNVE